MPAGHILKYLVVCLAGLGSSLLLTRCWRGVAPRLGMIDYPGGRKMHGRPVPVGGGIAVFFGFHIACAVLFLFPWNKFGGQVGIEWWFRFIPLSIAIVSLGLIDDRFGMKPAFKLLGQVLIAVAAYGLQIRVQNVLGLQLPGWVDFFITVLWFLAIMNAFNLIDGLDGLAVGIALIAAVGIAVSLIFRRSSGDVLLFAGFAGACLGFLRYNYYPASIFLGDTGSLFIGFTLAAMTISTSSKGTAIAAIGVPLLAVGVPLFDAVLAVWRRSVRRILYKTEGDLLSMGIDQGDADHLHHRLLRRGHRHDQVAWMLYAATALLAVSGMLATAFNDHVLGILGMTFIMAVYVVFRHLTWVELRDTGEVIVRGITRPVRRNLSLLFYILSDLAILNMAWLIATILVGPYASPGSPDIKALWLRSAPLDVTVPFLVLLGFRAYSRVWSLAGILEYAVVGVAVLFGGAMSYVISLLRAGLEIDRLGILLHYTVLIGLAIPAIVGVRAFFRLVPELLHRHRGADDTTARPRALLFGEGQQAMLYLRSRALSSGAKENLNVVGIVSSDEALYGHFISGIRVLGLPQEIPALVHQKKVDTLVLAGDIDEALMSSLRDALRNSGIRLIHWNATVRETEL